MRIITGLFALITVLAIFAVLFSFSAKKKLNFLSRASSQKANLVIDTKQIKGRLQYNWKALAQGGEERGGMLHNITDQLSILGVRYIRIDHIYDFYDVVSRNADGTLKLDFSKLDETVCDIYHAQAKPFFVLGYMPEVLSGDTSLISAPKNWDEWSATVQKTIEHYSGNQTVLCGGVAGSWLEDVYYEVWNEPDLETFGKWSIYGGKDYKTLYYYSVLGAGNAQSVNKFFIGGPVTTKIYKNWLTTFLRFAKEKNIRVDFISWHHYSKNTNDYTQDMVNIDSWLSTPEFEQYRNLPRIISEWGYDSEPNPIAHTNVGAAHTVASIRNLIEQGLEMAFGFEVKDGPEPRWGILSFSGEKKPRYYALTMLNALEGYRLKIEGEGSFVKALASFWQNKIAVVMVNYDEGNTNIESVPLTLTNVPIGSYTVTQHTLDGQSSQESITVGEDGMITRTILMAPNAVVSLEFVREL